MKKLYALWLYAVLLLATSFAGVQSIYEEKRTQAEMISRVSSISETSGEWLSAQYHSKRLDRIARMVGKFKNQNRVLSVALCPSGALPRAIGFPRGSNWEALCQSSGAKRALKTERDQSWSASGSNQRLQYFAHYFQDESKSGHRMVQVFVQDVSFLPAKWMESFLRTFLLTLISGTLLLSIAITQIKKWLEGHFTLLRQSLRSLVAGRKFVPIPSSSNSTTPEIVPISQDINQLAAKIFSLPKSDRNDTQEALGDHRLIVIANREPYIHQKTEHGIKIMRPASGVVTALEPILRKCGGLWIAHGGGSADRETADSNGMLAVPPENPRYALKRVWLTEQEEEGYYYGFSNEGFWPLCHLAHNRPIFRLKDWLTYQIVNQRFATAIPDDQLNENSLILVQDYHFALVPQMIRRRTDFKMPKIGLFWHIPWPNPEAFGICPWNKELLEGMLGADVIGFHTQYHCNNFLETCNRYLEARVDLERFSVTMGNHETQVKAFPIGIDTSPVRTISEEERVELKERYGIKAKWVAVGVDRLDYTKGLIERVEAVERFLEKNPAMVGQFSLVQMGSPTRVTIPAYRQLSEQLDATVNRINQRFADEASGYKPILFIPQHHQWDDIQYFYQLGQICMVTSLHDGMNLVAKEYVWCQRPELGSLILSKFTGASRELTEAFIVNPYSIEEMADAIAAAIAMPDEERTRRMLIMREKVQSHNAHHWAADLVRALVTQPESSPIETRPWYRQPGELTA